MTAHDMDCSAKRLILYKKSMITVITALLLISSAVTLTLSPFQNASATKLEANPRLPPTSDQEQQQTGTGTLQPQGEEEEEDKKNKGKGKDKVKIKHNDDVQVFVPIATSGNYIYLAWPSNKTTADFEIMFKASTDGGKTFGTKINLSNSTGIDSERPEIAAAGNNVYVSWWERNATSNEPVLKISNDNGETFGPILKLAANGTIGGG